ncbi:MAG: SH3 domain-containing protein [Myxococcota bacterium]|nr:SH3 domain-containing protein [Myxococcota bacterium]
MAVYQRVESDRADRLEREVARLRADLRQAEQALVSAEFGLTGIQSRADVVSLLAQARIRIERASRSAPWRTIAISEARGKLDNADTQVQRGNFGAATFFIFSAKRISSSIEREAHQLKASQDARFIRGRRVNLRSGPSTQELVLQTLVGGTPVFAENDGETWSLVRTLNGQVGWVHASLLEAH